MLRQKTFMITAFFMTLTLAALVLLAAGHLPLGTLAEDTPPSPAQNLSTKEVEAQEDAGSRISAKKEPIMPQETPQDDRQSLLKRHCAQCHPVSWLEQIKKSHGEWESTLMQMEMIGVQLSDTEKADLLAYLAIADEPR